MAHLSVSVEYGIHCLVWLVGSDTPMSSRDLAELQGVSHSLLAKIFPKLEKAGIVRASEGVRGGYVLARPADEINFLQIVEAIDGRKPLFECQEVRGRCAIFENQPPDWVTGGVCAVHAVMLQADKAMRDTLARKTLGQLAQGFADFAPAEFKTDLATWIGARLEGRVRRPSAPSDQEGGS